MYFKACQKYLLIQCAKRMHRERELIIKTTNLRFFPTMALMDLSVQKCNVGDGSKVAIELFI